MVSIHADAAVDVSFENIHCCAFSPPGEILIVINIGTTIDIDIDIDIDIGTTIHIVIDIFDI